MSKATPLKLVSERSPQREALALAIANVAQAEGDLKVARDAAGKARDRAWAAQDRLDVLREEHQTAPANPADAFILAMRENRVAGVAELEGPAKSHQAEEAAIQAEIDALSSTRAAIAAAIPAREKALSDAKSKLAGAVAEVLRSEIDVPTLLAAAEKAEADIVSRRCALITIQSLLPPSDAKAAVDRFLARKWLLHEGNGEYARHPAAQAITAARDALMGDADAALEG
jgi:chromosome segregation ATPase